MFIRSFEDMRKGLRPGQKIIMMAKKLIKKGKSKADREVQIWEHSEYGGYYHIKYHTGAATSFNSYLPTNSVDKPKSYWRERAGEDFKSYLEDKNPNVSGESLVRERQELK